MNDNERIVKAIVEAMGEGWEYGTTVDNWKETVSETHFHVRNDSKGERYQLELTFDGWRNEGRISVCGNQHLSDDRSYVRLWGDDDENTKITVAKTKAPEAIAKDILRRCVPVYDRVYAKCMERVNGENEYARKIEANRSLVCNLFGIANPSKEEDRYGRSDRTEPSAYGNRYGLDKVRISTDSVTLTFEVPIGNLESFVEAIRGVCPYDANQG